MANSDEERSREQPGTQSVPAKDHSSEATSKKTLRDIEESEKDSGSASGDYGSGPAPDGQFDESGETKNADPM